MEFKVLPGNPLFDKLQELKKEMDRCNQAARDFIKDLGYTKCRQGYMVLAGGISSIVIEGGQPKDWRKSYDDGVIDEYFPAKRTVNKELLKKIKELPVVKYEALNNLLHYSWIKHEGLKVSFHPGFFVTPDYVTIEVANYMNYRPIKHMIEITRSEYNSLTQTKKIK